MSQNPFQIILEISLKKDKKSQKIFNEIQLCKNLFDMSFRVKEAKRLFEIKRKSIVALRFRLNPQPIELVSFKIDNNQITYRKI